MPKIKYDRIIETQGVKVPVVAEVISDRMVQIMEKGRVGTASTGTSTFFLREHFCASSLEAPAEREPAPIEVIEVPQIGSECNFARTQTKCSCHGYRGR